jgi:hypothetical protein
MMRSRHTVDGGKPPTNPWGSSIARKRCPKCKKVRAKWFGGNHVFKPRAMWQHLDGQLVCHLCAERAGLTPKLAGGTA